MLKGKTIFVSGGTGFLGESIIKKCVGYGAKVIFSYHKSEKKAKEIIRKYPNTSCIKINLLDVNDINNKIRNLYNKIKTINVLINNAGISQVMPYSLTEEEDFDLVIGINVKGTFFLTKAIVRNMIRDKKGNIINIGSIAGHRMYEVPVHYAISKAAIQGFTYSLTSELKRYNIQVNSVVPGMVEGGISKGIPEDLKQDFIKHCAKGRAAKAEEIAEVACFLASDRSSYINGQNILVDGGI